MQCSPIKDTPVEQGNTAVGVMITRAAELRITSDAVARRWAAVSERHYVS